jgi:hypothetical protein
MTDIADPQKHDADRLVAIYIRIRDAKVALAREYEAKIADLETQLGVISSALLNICKENNQDGGKTAHGSFRRTVSTRYWTSDWNAMKEFIKEHDALELMEERIHQGNMKAFLAEHPDLLPTGLNADSKYTVSVRRSTKLK